MQSTARQHAGAGLVAAGMVTAGLAQGLFQPLGYAAAAIVIWAALIAGLVARALPANSVGSTAAVAGVCFAAIAVLATASVLWASDQGRAFDEAVRTMFFLGLFVLATCTANRGGRTQWLTGLTVGLGAVTVIALFSYLQPGILDSGGSDVPNAAGRLAYPLGYWNAAGSLFATTTVLLAYGGARATSRALRAASTAAIPLACLGIWLADSRGAGVAVVLGLALLVAASADRFALVRTIVVGLLGAGIAIAVATQLTALTSGAMDSAARSDGDLLTAVILAVVGAVGVLAWLADGWTLSLRPSRGVVIVAAGLALLGIIAGVIAADPVKRFDEFKAPPSASAGVSVGAAEISSNGRWQFWGGAVHAFEDDPIGGLGAGGFEQWWGRHASVPLFVRNPHSLPLQQAAELGIPGILLFAGFVGALLLAARRRFAAGLDGDAGVLAAVVLTGAVGSLVDWTWETPAAFGPTVVCAALLLGSAASRRLARNGYWLGIATVAAAWVAMIAGGLVVLSELDLRQSRSDAAAGRLDQAIDRARSARTVQPWSADSYTQLSLVEEARGNYDAALTYLKQAQRRDSDDWRLSLIEARLQAERGNDTAATLAYVHARHLSPFTPIVYGGQGAN
jgi:hypothetical protein